MAIKYLVIDIEQENQITFFNTIEKAAAYISGRLSAEEAFNALVSGKEIDGFQLDMTKVEGTK